MSVRTRFSPSPTGMIHLGNARAALYSACYAAQNQGSFILRIEDTDATRSEERHVDSLVKDLHWLGIDWQEGPEVNGDYGPYWQSQRQPIYDKFYRELEDKKVIYPCFCTDHELMLSRKVQLSRGLAPRYAGICRRLSAEEIQQRLDQGQKPAWRFAVPAHQTVEFVDAVKGPQSFRSDDIGDFIVRRADGTPPFLFCNAIDDATMKVTHVLRGEDHLSNTPRQILILQTLGLAPPQYGHLSMIMGDDGTPLSKRHGSFNVNDLREKGYLPMAILNYLARLGHRCESQNLLPFSDSAKEFVLDHLSHSAAHFDLSQLHYWQKHAVHHMEADALWQWLGEDIKQMVPANKQQLFAEVIKANVEFPDDAAQWAKLIFNDHFAFDENDLAIMRNAGTGFFATVEQAVEKHGTDFAKVLAEVKQTLQIGGKQLFMPLRIALSGKTNGPELAHIAELLGKEEMIERLRRAAKMLGGENNVANI